MESLISLAKVMALLPRATQGSLPDYPTWKEIEMLLTGEQETRMLPGRNNDVVNSSSISDVSKYSYFNCQNLC